MKSYVLILRFPIYPQPPLPTSQTSPTIKVLHQTSKSVTINEPMMTNHYHLKTTVYIRAHSRCWT